MQSLSETLRTAFGDGPITDEEGDMPSAHREIETATRISRDRASALLAEARLSGASRAELDALADYADEQRDHWLQAVQDFTSATFGALDYECSPA